MTHITMDVHKIRSTMAYCTPSMDEAAVRRFLTTREDLERVLSDLPRPWVVAVESSRESPPVCKWLREMAAEDLRLANAQEVAKFTAGKPKTDPRDALTMLELLELDRLPECYLASEEVQDRRALSRTRQSFRSMSTQLRNIIRAQLTQHGLKCDFSNLLGKAAQEELAELVEQLPELTAFVMRELVDLLLQVEERIESLDRRIAEEVAKDEVSQQLMLLAGVGVIIGFGLRCEIGEIERFADPKRLNSCAGLAPVANDSDEHHGQRRLPRRCNTRLRHWAVLAAQSAAKRKTSSKARRTYYRVKRRHPAGVAKIAAARVLMQDVFYRWRAAIEDLPAAG